MAKTFRLDIRYIPEAGINSLRRVDRLTETMTNDGFCVSDIAVFDDGIRVAMAVETAEEGRAELKLLTLVSATGSIGRFSCREIEDAAPCSSARTGKTEAALA